MAGSRVLVVDDQEILRRVLCKYLLKEGFEPIEASQGEQAIDLYRATRPAVVLSDIMMPKMDGLALLKRIKEIDNQAVVVLMTGYGSEEILMEALRGGATHYFKKPFNFQELVDFLSQVIEHRREADVAPFYSSHLVAETKSFVFETCNTDIHPIINQVSLHLKNIVTDSDIVNLKVGIEEIITNAIEHGNLGITFEMKSEAIEGGTWGRLLESKLNEDGNSHKRVHVESALDTHLFTITIRDEGKGFDWRSLPEVSAGSLLTFNGRGIFLTKIYFDEVLFNAVGNEVTLIKRSYPPPDRQSDE